MKQLISMVISFVLAFQASANYGMISKTVNDIKSEVSYEALPSNLKSLYNQADKLELNQLVKVKNISDKHLIGKIGSKKFDIKHINEQLFVVNGQKIDMSHVQTLKQLQEKLQPVLGYEKDNFVSFLQALFIPQAQAGIPVGVVVAFILFAFIAMAANKNRYGTEFPPQGAEPGYRQPVYVESNYTGSQNGEAR